MRWLMEFKMMHVVKVTPITEQGTDAFSTSAHQDCPDYQTGELDTIKEVPETGNETSSSTQELSSLVTQPYFLESCSSGGASTPINGETFSTGCIEASPSSSQSKTDHEDALSADEGIQTSPPFETDDPWDDDLDTQSEITTTPNKRRYSMSAVSPRSPRSTQEVDGKIGVTLRSPTRSWLAEEVKARTWRYRPKSCSVPHIDWLKQRTETALDRSAEMQRRTAELLRSAKTVRDQDA